MRSLPPRDEFMLQDVWGALRRRWPLVVVGPLVGVAIAVAYLSRTVPLYEAASTIRVSEESGEIPVLDILETVSTGSELATEMVVLQSRVLAEEVVDTLALQLHLIEPRGEARATLLERVFVERWAPGGRYIVERDGDRFTVTEAESSNTLGVVGVGEPVALPGATFTLRTDAEDQDRLVVIVRPFNDEVAALRQAVGVGRPNRDASVIRVRYASTDTQLVHLVPNTLARRFIERRERIRRTRATSTVTFLENQIDTLSRKLAAAEDTLTAFREGQQVVSLQAEAQAQVTQLARLQADRNTLEAERAALQRLMDDITREAETSDPTAPSPFTRLISFPSLLRNAATSELLRTLNQANSEKSELLRRRTLQDPDVVSISSRIHEIEAQLRGTAQTYLQGLTNQVRAYDQTLAQFGTELGRIPAKELQLARLAREQAVLEEVFTLLQNRLQEARIAQAIEDPTIRQIDPAIRESTPVRPRPLVNLFLGVLLGSVAGLIAVGSRELFDNTIHSPESLEQASGGEAILGMIPRLPEGAILVNGDRTAAASASVADRLAMVRDPLGPAAEAFRSLRTNLTFATPDRTLRSILITSSLPEDGKSTVATNLAVAVANQGSNVLMVDGDLRRGVVHAILGANRDPGLTDVLAGRVPLTEAIQQVDLGSGAKVSFLSTGFRPPNPAEVLGSKRMAALLDGLTSDFDFVIIDTPPVTAVTDASVLGTRVDGVLLVARAGYTPRDAVKFSSDQLRRVHANIIGTVLNDVDPRRDGSYYGAYGEYRTYAAESSDVDLPLDVRAGRPSVRRS